MPIEDQNTQSRYQMLITRIFNRNKANKNFVTVVSGLPRSGTSMMMQILAAGGISPITDNVRVADEDNAKGYYEHEEVKSLAKGKHDCLNNAEGRTIKVISSLLKHLPDDRHYKVIFMNRQLDEVLASQAKMLINLDKAGHFDNDAELKVLYQTHVKTLKKWLQRQSNIDVLHLNYHDVIAEPSNNIDSIVNFLQVQANIDAMTAVVDRDMRHHR